MAAILDLFLIEKGPGPPSTFGYADDHRVQIYVSITQKMKSLVTQRDKGQGEKIELPRRKHRR